MPAYPFRQHALTLLAACLVAPAAWPQEPRRTPGDGLFPGRPAGEGGEKSGGGTGPGEPEELPAPFERFEQAFDLGRLQRRFDESRGRDVERSDKPRAPELPVSLFNESIRPLGSLKYENQLNYFAGGFTGDAPTLQTLTYEYVFADWNAARFELIAPGGRATGLGFGYQRTFGVGPRGNWVHGALIQTETAIDGSGFVGGTALYTVAWKPERESPFTATLSVGASRASFATRPLGGSQGGLGSMMIGREGQTTAGQAAAEEEARVWRTFAGLNVFYTLSPSWTVGTELDAFAHRRFGEYLALPNVTYRPTKHFFVQFGAGYYEVAGRGQATFQCRMNLLNPSPRRAREE